LRLLGPFFSGVRRARHRSRRSHPDTFRGALDRGDTRPPQLLCHRTVELHRHPAGIPDQQPGQCELVVLLYGGEASRDRAGGRDLLSLWRFHAGIRHCRTDLPHVAGRRLDGAEDTEDRPLDVSAALFLSCIRLPGDACRRVRASALHGCGIGLSASCRRGPVRRDNLLRGACRSRRPPDIPDAQRRIEARSGFGMKLTYFKGHVPNFGDELNTYMWPRLLPRDFLDDDDGELFLGIGSILWEHYPKEARKYVLGSGYGGYAAAPNVHDGTWDVIFVRGPRTAAQLDLPPSKGICDSAILLRKLDLPAPAEDLGIAFMPHFHSFSRGHWPEACAQAG